MSQNNKTRKFNIEEIQSPDARNQNDEQQPASLNMNETLQHENRRKIQYIKLYYNSKTWPACLEKSLIKCIFFCIIKRDEQYGVTKVENIEDELLKELDFMKERLKIEGLESDEHDKFIQCMKIHFKNQYWEAAYKEADVVFKAIRVLDIERIRELISEIDVAHALLHDKDVILLLGPTGSGKSTCIHFLAGSKMEKVKKFGLNHVEPVENPFDPTLLKRITTSPFPTSETQYVTAAEIVYRSVGMTKKGSIFLCDTPGFEDTNGPEVDITNSVGMIRVVKSCQTVRPVIVISAKDYSYARMKGLKCLAHILVNMVNEINEYISSFSFIMTKFSDEEKSDFREQLESLTETILAQDSDDKTFVMFLDELVSKIDTFGPKFVDPLNGNRKDLLKYLDGISPINRPSEAFKFSISQTSTAAIKDQLRIHQMMLLSSVKESDYALVEYKLKEIKYLKELLNQEFINQIYQECLRGVLKIISGQYDDGIKNFNNCINTEKMLTESDINEYRIIIEHGKRVDSLSKHFELKEIPSSAIFAQNLSTQVSNLQVKIKKASLDNDDLKKNLDKLKLLSHHFQDIPFSTSDVEEKMTKSKQSFSKSVTGNKYDECAKISVALKNAILILSEHLDLKKIAMLQNEMKQELNKHLKSIIIEKLEPCFQKKLLTNDDIEEIKEKFAIVQSAKNAFNSQDDYQMGISMVYEELVNRAVLHFNQLNENIVKLFKTEQGKNVALIEPEFNQMSLLFNIPQLSAITAQAYYSVLEMICSYIDTLKRDINNEMNTSVFTDTKFELLFEMMGYFEQTKWIEIYKPGIYNEMMDAIKENMSHQLVVLKESLMSLNLELNNYENLKEAVVIIDKIMEMDCLKIYIPELTDSLNESKSWFMDTTRQTVEYIKECFNLNSPSVEQQQQKVVEERLNRIVEQVARKQQQQSVTTITGQVTRQQQQQQQVAQEQEVDKTKKKKNFLSKIKDHFSFNPRSNQTSYNIQADNDIQSQQSSQQQILTDDDYDDEQQPQQQQAAPCVEQEPEVESKAQKVPHKIVNLPLCHIKTADNALKYLTFCTNSKFLRKSDYGNVLIRLEDYIKQYSESLKQELDCLYNDITSYIDNTQKSKLYSDSQILHNRVKELCEINKHIEVSKRVNYSSNLFETLKSKMANYASELNEEIERLQITKRVVSVNTKLEIAKCLKQFDEIFENKNFETFYKEILDLVHQNAPRILLDLNEAIQKKDFLMLYEMFSDLSNSSDPYFKHYLKESKRSLNIEVNGLIERTKIQSRLFVNSIGEENSSVFSEIISNLNCLSKLQALNEHIDEFNNIEAFKQSVQKTLTEGFICFMENIESTIRSLNFPLADSAIKMIKMKIDILDFYCTEEIMKKFNNVKALLSNELENLKQKYRDKKIDSYMMYPPKDDFLKLKGALSLHYSNILESVSDIIIEKFRVELIEIQKQKQKRLKEQGIKRLSLILTTLPENVHLILYQEIERAKDDIIAQDEEINESLCTAIANKDLEFLEAHIAEYKMYGLNCQYVSKIVEFLKDESHELNNEIKKSLCLNEIVRALKLFKSLIDYKNFSQKHLETRRLRESKDSYNELSSRVSQNFTNLSNFFQSKNLNVLNTSSVMEVNSSVNLKEAFEILTNISSFRKSSVEIIDQILPDFCDACLKLTKLIIDVLQTNKKKFKEIIGCLNIASLKQVLDNMKSVDQVSKEIKMFFMHSIHETPIEIDDLSFRKMLNEVESRFKDLKRYFENIDLINDTTSKYEKERLKFYEQLSERIAIAKEAHQLNDHAITSVNLSSFESDVANLFTAKKDNISKKLHSTFLKPKFMLEDCKMFNIYLSNLKCLAKYVTIGTVSCTNDVAVVQSKFLDYVDKLKYGVEGSEAEQAAVDLIQMKTLADNIPVFKKLVDGKIDTSLKAFKNKKGKTGGQAISKLGTILNNDPIGKIIINEHKILEGFLLALFNDKVAKHDIDYVLNNLTGDGINTEKLKKRFDEYQKTYQKLVEDNLRPNPDLKEFVAKIKVSFTRKNKWDHTVVNRLPELIAHIFALWTLNSSVYYYENEGLENQDLYLLKPHPAQVISIFRLFGVGDDKEVLKNNICEIGTGEGKSVTLAVTACVLAIFNYQISCACYSEYLSQRDYQAFLPMFTSLGIVDRIEYGTFNQICENIINEDGDIRDRVVKLINDEKYERSSKKNNREKILLIDEVDVFLNKEFYGNVYRPVASISDLIKPLADFIWEKKSKRLNIDTVKDSPAYKAWLKKYVEWSLLIDEAIKSMISDVNCFDTPTYVVENDKIGYVELDGVSFTSVYSYKTMFAYYHEHQLGRISAESLLANVDIHINCGVFSYAEIPYRFKHILGVTGTLKSLSNPEREVTERVYNIEKKTFIPSVFGKTNLSFVDKTDVMIESGDDYENRITREIECRLMGKIPGTERAVLVFFESRTPLMKFYNSKAFIALKDFTKLLTEEDNLTLLEKDKFIKDATRAGAISLITKSFGRGTDFVCRDDIVQANGGVHVLLTFLPEQLSDEIQIKGRTARQGDFGSFSMVLLNTDLEKYQVTINDIETNLPNIYEFSNCKRNAFFQIQYESNKQFIEYSESEHIESLAFLENMSDDNLKSIKAYLVKKNKGNDSPASYSKTIVLMDATGSMGSLLTQAKNTVGMMFERAIDILKEFKLPTNCFQLQFACYRDYDCGPDAILQASSWETKANNLRAFMATIKAMGGGDYEEAIEIGFQHVAQEHAKEKVSQVILIGDAPAKSRNQVIADRKKYGGETEWVARYGPPTYYLNELRALKANSIPVFAFYLENGARKNFEEIASVSETLDKCKLLNINSGEGHEMLTHVVTRQILANIGAQVGKGGELAEAYMKKFAKCHK